MKDKNQDDLTIIVSRSSAGGLEAICELVATLSAKLPVSCVVVQLMSPHHKSLMTQLVARQTELRFKDVTDGVLAGFFAYSGCLSYFPFLSGH